MRFDWGENPDLNITPLVDIMLVLLAILMVSTPAVVYEELIKLPSGSKTDVVQKMPDLEIRVTRKLKIYIGKNKKSIAYKNFPNDWTLKYGKLKNKNITVYIKADKDLKYEYVMSILGIVKNSGFRKISLETD